MSKHTRTFKNILPVTTEKKGDGYFRYGWNDNLPLELIEAINNEGKHEMDASLMNGKDLSAGAVAGVQNIKNPISLARGVMEKSEHVFMAGLGAQEFAKK